jgi:hypothetical protein
VAVGGIFAYKGFQKDSLYKTALKNVSEAHYFVKSQKGGQTTVQFISGKREADYKQNGLASGAANIAFVSVIGGAILKDLDQIDAKVTIGEGAALEQYDIVLKLNMFDKKPLSFGADLVEAGLLKREIAANEKVSVTLFPSSPDAMYFEDLESAFGEDAISWDKALQIATAKVGNKLKGQTFESYVTATCDVAEDSGAFWYVQFITADAKTAYAIIDAEGSVIDIA